MDTKEVFNAAIRGFIDSFKGMLTIFYLDKEINERTIYRQSPPRSRIRQKNLNTSENTSTRQLKKHDLTFQRIFLAAPFLIPIILYTRKESTVTKKLFQCAILNGGIFLVSILLFEYGLLPLINTLCGLLFGDDSFMRKVVWYWIEYFALILFRTAWVLPLFLICKIINALWFQDIADSAYRYSRGRPRLFSSFSQLCAVCADSSFSLVIQCLFLIQATLTSYIPIYGVGYTLSLIQICLLYSLYAFEYKWYNMGWELHKRLAFIEANWPYFIGFGLPLALVTQLPESWVISGCLFSLLFPFVIISGNEASPVTGVSDIRLHLFSPVIAISNMLFSKTIGKRKESVAVSQQAHLHRNSKIMK